LPSTQGRFAQPSAYVPNLSADEFLPWVDDQEAVAAGLNRREFAARQADLWRKGLADWAQGPERIERLRSAAEFAVYTPGSRAGLPVNALGSFAPPPARSRMTGIFCVNAL